MRSWVAAALALPLLVAVGVVGSLWALRKVEQAVPLPLPAPMVSTSPGSHYFINDLVGFGESRADLPAAFIISHSARAAQLVAQADGFGLRWADAAGVSQDASLPGWGGMTALPPRQGTLQLDYLQTMVVGRFSMGPARRARVRVSLPWRARFVHRGAIDVQSQRVADSSSRFELVLTGEGMFQLEPLPPPSDGFPIRFETEGLSLDEIVIGGELRSPSDAAFSLSTRDLHSLALGEFDGDAGAEFSVVRGGVRGLLANMDMTVRDLLFDTDQQREINRAGFDKAGCPGRQSAWVDFNNDGRLDLYVVCGRGEGASSRFANRLFRAGGSDASDEGFREVAAEVGLALESNGSFRFVDWNDDGWQDLVWVDSSGVIQLWFNDNGRFRLAQTINGRRYVSHQVPQLLLSDVDGDSAVDLAIIHREGNQLLLNRANGALLDAGWRQRGLPGGSLAGVWLDFNLDGTPDFFSVDRGLFLGRGKVWEERRFERTGGQTAAWQRHFFSAARVVSIDTVQGRKLLLAFSRCLPGRLCRWRRELLIGAREQTPIAFALQHAQLLEPEQWDLAVIDSGAADASHREVTVNLHGTPHNPYGIGASLRITAASGSWRHWVGEAETSHFSQGNYAVYLSLPRHQSALAEVVWADGCRQQVSIAAEAARVRVKRDAGCPQVAALR